MEFLGVNVQSGDDFSVDDLLTFADDDVLVAGDEEESHEGKHEGEDRVLCSVSGGTANLLHQESPVEIAFLEDDDLADLEWLSQFVGDSFDFPEQPALQAEPAGQSYVNRSEPEVDGSVKLRFDTPVPGKARSKRARTGGRIWSVLYGPFSSSPSSSGSFSSSGSQSLEPGRLGTTQLMKKRKRKRPRTELWSGSSGQPVRRCSHCGVQETPQWRAGPMGAKTLCNACGVRFKSGRLLPEYRPASSPTFCSELHSNHHRKVLEMRRKKELLGSG